MSLGTLKLPSMETLREVAAELGMTFDEAELADHRAALAANFAAYGAIDKMPDEVPEVRYPRTPGVVPQIGRAHV